MIAEIDNSYFIYSKQKIVLERFHVCTWEFNKRKPLIEFGFEITQDSIQPSFEMLEISLIIPWLKGKEIIKDLFEQFKQEENSRFIFNDTIKNVKNIDGEKSANGVICEFGERTSLCFLPIEIVNVSSQKLTFEIDLNKFQKATNNSSNIYTRFYIEPTFGYISRRKNGINKSTIIYDIKVNEKRNLPESLSKRIENNNFCKIKNCFLFNIIPNKYDIIFQDNRTLKNIRNLEFEQFSKYLGDIVDISKERDLLVVFNKKNNKEEPFSEPFSFFSIYTEEMIGMPQLAIAIFINILCGLILAIKFENKYINTIAIGILLIAALFPLYPYLKNSIKK